MMDKVEDKFSSDAMTEYFLSLYKNSNTFDKVNISTLVEKPDMQHPDSLSLQFETASDNFHLIDDDSIGIVVNYENSMELIEQLKITGPYYSLMKKLGQYTVSLRKRDFEKLEGVYEEAVEGVYFIKESSQYDDKVGLLVENHIIDEILIK